jgi:hypothetical protein
LLPLTVATGATGTGQPSDHHVDLKGPAAWSEHLHYDLNQVRAIEEIWRAGTLESLSAEVRLTVKDALLDSFAIRLRGITEFFDIAKQDHFGRRFTAADYLGAAQAETWRKKHIPSDVEQNLERIWREASLQVAHLMRDRTHDQAEKTWDLTASLRVLTPVVRAFVRAARSKLSQNCDWHVWAE